jgi:hypothetical protein
LIELVTDMGRDYGQHHAFRVAKLGQFVAACYNDHEPGICDNKLQTAAVDAANLPQI